jgi:uracil-DNA glycosylase family 4
LEKKGLGFVEPAGPLSASLAFVGQGPGEQENYTGIPFYPNAPAGQMLTRWMNRAGIPRTEVFVCNVTQCWWPKGYKGGRPFGSVDPPREAIAQCWREYVGPALYELENLRLLVPVGAPSRQWFLGPEAGERYCGTANLVELPELT